MHSATLVPVVSAVPAVMLDNITLIRVVSGVLAVVVLFTLIYRMKKKAPR